MPQCFFLTGVPVKHVQVCVNTNSILARGCEDTNHMYFGTLYSRTRESSTACKVGVVTPFFDIVCYYFD